MPLSSTSAPKDKGPHRGSPFTLSPGVLPEALLPTLTRGHLRGGVCPVRVTLPRPAVSGSDNGRAAAGAGGPGRGGPEGAVSGEGGQHPVANGAALGHGSRAAAGHTAGQGWQRRRTPHVARRSPAGRACWRVGRPPGPGTRHLARGPALPPCRRGHGVGSLGRWLPSHADGHTDTGVTLSAPRQAWIQGGTRPKQTQRHGGSRKTKLKTFFCVEKQLPAALEQVLFFSLENWTTISPRNSTLSGGSSVPSLRPPSLLPLFLSCGPDLSVPVAPASPRKRQSELGS